MPSHGKRGGLLRSLSRRHVQFIAVGGAIGSGLFYGSAQTIGLAGPGVLIGYLLGGGIVFIVMRALGEMAVAEPVSGSFSDYAHKIRWTVRGLRRGMDLLVLLDRRQHRRADGPRHLRHVLVPRDAALAHRPHRTRAGRCR